MKQGECIGCVLWFCMGRTGDKGLVAQGVDRPEDDIDSTGSGGNNGVPFAMALLKLLVSLSDTKSGDGSSRTTPEFQSSCE
jgi:hypothetical protein